MGPTPAFSENDKERRRSRLSEVHVFPSVKQYLADRSPNCTGYAQHDSAGRVTVVVDVLRATTSIVSAIQAGAAVVVPLCTPECCKETARELNLAGLDQSLVVLSGAERGGRKVEGFDLGNSPQGFRETVRNKVVLFHTTNGTKGLLAAAGHMHGTEEGEPACSKRAHAEYLDRSYPVLIMSLLNVQAVARALICHDRFRDCAAVDILCCGTDSEFSVEDSLCAGALADALKRLLPDITLSSPPAGPDCQVAQTADEGDITADILHPLQLNDLAWGCWQLFLMHRGHLLPVMMGASLTGRRLTRIHGLHADVAAAAQLDAFDDIVPMYHRGVIEPLSATFDTCVDGSQPVALVERVRDLLPSSQEGIWPNNKPTLHIR